MAELIRNVRYLTRAVSLCTPMFKTFVLEVWVERDEGKVTIKWTLMPVLAMQTSVRTGYVKSTEKEIDEFPDNPKTFRTFGWRSMGETVDTVLMVRGIEGELVEEYSCEDVCETVYCILVEAPYCDLDSQLKTKLRELTKQLSTEFKLPDAIPVIRVDD